MKTDIDIRQLPSYSQFMERCGWKVISYYNHSVRKKQFIYLWEVNPINSVVIRLHRVNYPIPLNLVEEIIQGYSYAHIRVEPNISIIKEIKETEKLLSHYGYTLSRWSHFPTKTSILDLTNTEKILLRSMKAKTRYNIRLAIRRGVVVKLYKGSSFKADRRIVNDFYKILTHTERARGLPIYPLDWLVKLLDSFDQQNTLALGYYKKQPQAGTLFLNSPRIMYYSLNGSSKLGRAQHVPSYIIWEAMRYSKRLGIQTLDFDGIYDERLSESTITWLGFTKFKNSFGGIPKTTMLPCEKLHRKNITLFYDIFLKILTPRFLPSMYPEPGVIRLK